MPNFANPAGNDYFSRLLQGGTVSIDEIDHVDEAACFRGLRHLARARIVGRQRLLAKDVFACCERGQRCRMMDRIRRHVRDSVEFAPGDRCIDRRESVRNAVGRVEGFESFGVDIDPADDADAVNRTVYQAFLTSVFML